MSKEVVRGDVFDWLPELDGGVRDAAVIDYPWEFDPQNGTNRFGDSTDADTIYELDYDLQDNDRLVDVLREVARVVVDGGWVFVFSDDKTLPEFRAAVEDADALERHRDLAWDREHFAMGYYFRVQHYPIVTATVGKTGRYVQDRGTIIRALKPSGNSKTAYPFQDYHTSKPPGLYEEMLAPPVLEDGEVLLEPFCGSAPGAAVAADRGLGYLGCDIRAEAVDMAKTQLSQESENPSTLSDYS